jgi:cbb3-type cytochrome oxidase maturation protein
MDVAGYQFTQTGATPNSTNMSALVILLLVSISIAASFLLAYVWSVRDGQFDDDYSPAHRILFPENRSTTATEKQTDTNTIKESR